MDKPNLNTRSREELLALYAAATTKLSQIAEAVSSQTGPRVITLRGRICGQTTALVLKLTEENVANNAKLQKVTSILDGDDMAGSEWECCQAIADLPDVDAALLAFADDPTGDQAVMIVRAVLRAATPERPFMEAAGLAVRELYGWVTTAEKPSIATQRQFWLRSESDDMAQWLEQMDIRGCQVTKTGLYTTIPQPAGPATDVAGLVEALQSIYDEDYQVGHDATDSEVSIARKQCIYRIRRKVKTALAAHQTRGGNS